MMPVQENSVRAKLAGRPQRHRGMHAKFARLIASRRDHPSLIRSPADHNRFANQFRSLQQFHGDEKRVHVHMQNRSRGGKPQLVHGTVDRSKSCQLRHPPSLRPIHSRANRSESANNSWPVLQPPSFALTSKGRAGGIWMARDYGHHAAAQVEVLRMGPYLPANPAATVRSFYVLSAARTRGMAARSFVTLTLVHFAASSSGWTAGRLS
jgi:hypothetical protein